MIELCEVLCLLSARLFVCSSMCANSLLELPLFVRSSVSFVLYPQICYLMFFKQLYEMVVSFHKKGSLKNDTRLFGC